MNAYSGNEPYVFVSYCHADGEIVEPIIVGLKREMCRVWYDEGLSPGESWNEDLANHLNVAHCVVALLTENSIKSRYVTAEINFAVSHDKKIIPINLDGCALPIGLELMISHIQIANLRNPNINSLVADIVDLLPREVFASKKVPFYETEEYRFFLERYTLPHPSSPIVSGPDAFSIVCKDRLDHEHVLFEFQAIPAYEVEYLITQCKEIRDDYFVGEIHGIVLLNVLAKCCLKYPLTGPDFDVLMIFALRVPDDGLPTAKMIDYQNMHIVQSLSTEGKKISESPWGQTIERLCQAKLYQ